MVNKVILIGNVGMDPEVRTLESGTKTARIRLATTERIFDRQANESREHTEWHTITLWRGLADVVDRYVRKGSQIYIEGRLRTREWTDNSGNKRYSTEIQADNMSLLGRRGDSNSENHGQSNYGQQPGNAYNTPGGNYGGSAYTQPTTSTAPAASTDAATANEGGINSVPPVKELEEHPF